MPLDEELQVTTVRIFYKKTGRVKYTSHLDTVRTLSRVLKRSGLPLWFTQGFNPHMYMTFALPISLGYESLCETMDIRLTKPIESSVILEKTNAAMPVGFLVYKVATPVMDSNAIAFADYSVRLLYNESDMQGLEQKFVAFCSQADITVTKKTKKGQKEIDIKPMVQIIQQDWNDQGIDFVIRTTAGNTQNINPSLYLKAFYSWCNILPEGVKIVRTAVYTDSLEIFE